MLGDRYKDEKAKELAADRESQLDIRRKMAVTEKIRIRSYLTDIGYSVTDISPAVFDILAESKGHTFYAAVIYRSSRGDIPIEERKIDLWLAYERPNTITNDRLVIVCTPGRQDSVITIQSILDLHRIGNSFIVPRHIMRSIVILRKILEQQV